jgi:hypothetical protein
VQNSEYQTFDTSSHFSAVFFSPNSCLQSRLYLLIAVVTDDS